jgi:hypothetical protein
MSTSNSASTGLGFRNTGADRQGPGPQARQGFHIGDDPNCLSEVQSVILGFHERLGCY